MSRADDLLQQVMGILQEAEEIGGPDTIDYIRLMYSVMEECRMRAAIATENLLKELKAGL